MPERKLRRRWYTQGLLTISTACAALLVKGDIGDAAGLGGSEMARLA
jgi:hypothetical protein